MSENEAKNKHSNSHQHRWIIGGVVSAVCGLFFLCYLVFSILTAGRFTSPDELANAYWGEMFHAQSVLWQFDPVNALLGDVVHPRSMRVVNGFLVPGGFIGFPALLGFVGKMWRGLMMVVTPLLAVLGAVSFGAIVGVIVRQRRVGVIVALLALLHPAWWYWSSRVFMSNVSALSLYIIACAFLVVRPFARIAARSGMRVLPWVDVVLSAACAAVAVSIRPVDAVWFGIAGVIAGVVYRARVQLRAMIWSFAAWCGAFALFLAPFLLLSGATFGSLFATGYGGELGTGVSESPLVAMLFPLSFAPRTALYNAWAFGVTLFPLWSCAAVIGFGVMVWRWWKGALSEVVQRAALFWVAVMVCIGAYMLLFYGSWALTDNPRLGAVTIGVSYTRYWLLLYLLSVIPFAAVVAWGLERVRSLWVRVVCGGAVFALAASAFCGVWYAPEEGLAAVVRVTAAQQEIGAQIIAVTEPDSVIITERGDKLLFPQRHVVAFPLSNPAIIEFIGTRASIVPLWYYGFTFSENDLEHLRDVRLLPYGLEFSPVAVFGTETLYRIIPSSQTP